MTVNSNNFAGAGAAISAAYRGPATSGVFRTGRHWILYLKSLVRLGLFLTMLNAGVFFFPSHFNFEVARLLVIAGLLVTASSLFVTWIEAQCNRYLISPKSIQIRHGLTEVSLFALSYSNIESVEVFQTIAGRFFDYGTVKIKGNSGSCKTLTYVANPNIFRQEC